MAHTAADGSKWSNAAQARKVPVPGRAQGDGKQPVTKFPKPAAPRAATAEPVTKSSESGSTEQDHSEDNGPQVEVTHDGSSFVVTAKFASEDEAHAAAQSLQQPDDSSQPAMNPAQAMM